MLSLSNAQPSEICPDLLQAHSFAPIDWVIDTVLMPDLHARRSARTVSKCRRTNNLCPLRNDFIPDCIVRGPSVALLHELYFQFLQSSWSSMAQLQ
jgi:hypothetical protein